jgi:hypothetical protein
MVSLRRTLNRLSFLLAPFALNSALLFNCLCVTLLALTAAFYSGVFLGATVGIISHDTEQSLYAVPLQIVSCHTRQSPQHTHSLTRSLTLPRSPGSSRGSGSSTSGAASTRPLG